MRRRSTVLARLRLSARSKLAAWVAIFALLVQTLIGAPLAARMAIDAAWIDILRLDGAICSAREHGDASADGDTSPGPSHGTHDHQHCVLCQAGAAPLLLASTALFEPAPATEAVAPFFYVGVASEARRAHDGAPRAPPRN
ncbi:MAG: DUF2946 family protein [Rhodospirillales bacterium]|nr:DUF2946 family protein [Rhodospirillales bacterium]